MRKGVFTSWSDTTEVRVQPADPATWFESAEPRRVARAAGLGALCGLAWGIGARLWMRLISTDPQFTWNGTLYIVLVPTVIGLTMGLVRSTRHRWAKRVATIVVFPLGMAAGALMLPTVLFGSLAYGRRTLPRWARAAFGVMAAASTMLVFGEVGKNHGTMKQIISFALYLGLCAWMVAMASVSLGQPASRAAEEPRALPPPAAETPG